MSYIGNQLTTQHFPVNFFDGDGTTVAFALSTSPGSATAIDVHVGGVYQYPGYGYNVSGKTITFTSAPPSGTNNICVVFKGVQVQIPAPADGSVTTDKVADSSITVSKLSDSAKAGSLVTEYEVTGSAVTNIDFSGLDITADKSYRIEVKLLNATASTATLKMYVNGDYTDSNYRYSYLYFATGGGLSSGGANAGFISNIPAGTTHKSISIIDLKLVDTKPIAQSFVTRTDDAGNLYTWRKIDAASVTNITSIRFNSSITNAIAVGSTVQIYRG